MKFELCLQGHSTQPLQFSPSTSLWLYFFIYIQIWFLQTFLFYKLSVCKVSLALWKAMWIKWIFVIVLILTVEVILTSSVLSSFYHIVDLWLTLHTSQCICNCNFFIILWPLTLIIKLCVQRKIQHFLRVVSYINTFLLQMIRSEYEVDLMKSVGGVY